MFSPFSSRHKKPGSPPGDAVFVGQQGERPFLVRRIDYDGSELVETQTAEVATLEREGRPGGVSWLNVVGLHESDQVAALGARFGMHPLQVDDVLNTAHRPKVEELDDSVFVIVPLLRAGEDGTVTADHFCLVFKAGLVLSFSDAPEEFLEPVVARLEAGRPRIRNGGSDYLAWALIDAVVDHALIALDAMEERLSALEERVEGRDPVSSAEVFSVKREVGQVHRRLRPLREIAMHLERSDSPLIAAPTRAFLRDLYDHSLRVIESTESLRETAANLRDYHMAEVSNRMNEVMKVLTCVATIFMPLGFLAGVYGMNFEWIPELSFKWGYPILWLVFLSIGGGLLWLFRRMRWL